MLINFLQNISKWIFTLTHIVNGPFLSCLMCVWLFSFILTYPVASNPNLKACLDLTLNWMGCRILMAQTSFSGKLCTNVNHLKTIIATMIHLKVTSSFWRFFIFTFIFVIKNEQVNIVKCKKWIFDCLCFHYKNACDEVLCWDAMPWGESSYEDTRFSKERWILTNWKVQIF